MTSEIAIFISVFLLSLVITRYLIPLIIKWHLQSRKMLLEDMNKHGRPKVPGLGGLSLVAGFVLATTIVIVIKTIFGVDHIDLQLLYPALLSVVLMAFVGFIDDVLVLTFRPGKIILALIASIPMISMFYRINLAVNLPFLPTINVGLIYPLLVIPLLIIFGSNAINVMADFDGLSPGNSIIITGALFLCSYFSHNPTAMFIYAALGGTLIVFYFYNRHPARVFTANVGTLFIGSVLAVGALIGNIKLPFLIIMVPYVIHFALQQRRSFAFGQVFRERPRERGLIQPSGELRSEYDRSYGLTHFVMIHLRKFTKVTEKKLVYSLMGFELIFALIAIFVHLKRIPN